MGFNSAFKGLMNLYCEFYDGRQALEKCLLHLVVILMYMDGFEPRVPEG